MTDLAHYSFLPWLRQGMAAKIAEQDTLGQALPAAPALVRPALSVSVKLRDISMADGSPGSTFIEKNVNLVGPGDIVGIHKDAIVQTEPKHQESRFEANCLAYIEFYEEDFVWRYTPASPDIAQHKLRPWLVLVVLAEGEYTYQPSAEGLPFITLHEDKMDEVFPPHTQTWAWAHVHVHQELLQPSGSEALLEELTQLLKTNPDAAVCRLLCPRKLKKETSYRAFLLPAFETGRLAGLNEPVAAIPAQAPAWVSGQAPTAERRRPFDFPVYHEWSFQTGLYGDFESLVSILKSYPVDPELGKRPMSIAAPGYGLNTDPARPLNSAELGLEGALQPPGFAADPWPNGSGDAAFRHQLRDILNVSENIQDQDFDRTHLPAHPFYSEPITADPIITPPIYGKNQAAIQRVGDIGNPAWVDELSLDPRARAVAGLGTQVVQENQDKLMESAWRQIGEVNAANQRIREAELAKQVSQALYRKHLLPMNSDRLLAATQAMHPKVLLAADGVTQPAQLHLEKSRIPLATKSAAFRRLIRPGKKSNKQMNALASDPEKFIHKNIIPRFNLAPDNPGGQTPLATAQPKAVPDMALNAAAIGQDIDQAIGSFSDTKSLAQHSFAKILENLRLPALDRNALLAALNSLALTDNAAIAYVRQMINQIEDYRVSAGVCLVRIPKVLFRTVYGEYMTGKYHNWVQVYRSLDTGEAENITRAVTQEELETFKATFLEFAGRVETTHTLPEVLPPLAALDPFSTGLKNKLDPLLTISRRVTHNLKVWSQAEQAFVRMQTLKPIMAYPKFSQPMLYALKKISQEFILPNMNKIPKNSLLLMESNQRFIEAYLAGLNHEMGRELLWREYPTDQRGTYFAKFWDTKDDLATAGGEDQKDIRPMHTWNGPLGAHNTRPGNYLVLLIRGELLQKYPNTIVYAQKAEFDTDHNAPRKLAESADVADTACYRYPVFQGSLDPDVALFGFELDKNEARGNRTDNPGWFFVLKERPGQIRFGLDDVAIDKSTGQVVFPTAPAASWNDLNWGHLVAQAADLEQLAGIRLDAPIRLSGALQAEWNSATAADLANYLFQNPVMFARHAQEMLPE